MIELGGFATDMASLFNAGSVDFGGSGGTILNVLGNYVGNDGTFIINSVLDGDGSITDTFRIGGYTSGNTNLKVINRGGLGAQTVTGIKVIDVGGQSNGTFSLIGDFVTRDGKQAIAGGAYAYTLQKGSGSGNSDGDWYLTSRRDSSDPDLRYSFSVPVYEGYLRNMQELSKLRSLQERVGERYRTDQIRNSQIAGAVFKENGVWARIEGAHNHLEPNTSVTYLNQDINSLVVQTGVDGQFYEDENGKLIAGISGQYGHAKSDIASFDGDGDISTNAWSLGATATWYGGNSGFYVDSQAKVTWFDSDLNSRTANIGLAKGSSATGYTLSVEAGQRFAFDQNWSLTPQAQLTYSLIAASAFRDTWNSNISLDKGNSLIGRLGIATSYANSWKGEDSLTVNTSVYAIANLYQQILSGTSVNVAGVDFSTDNDRTWGGIGGGGTYAWHNNKYVIYGEGSINSTLNHFAESYAIKGTVGLMLKW
ncbi:outer membrane autotransporter protein [Ochrobactrum sp. BH3]|nr:outer membrane autotransporter protein [Ochrobactrum sp. BH3]